MKRILITLIFIILSGFSTAHASLLFFDDFNSGLNPSVWTNENESGAMWQVQYDGPNGHLHSQPQISSDRYLDILSNKNDFSNFTMSFDINFLNNGNHQDWRRIYLRTNGSIENHSGYAINIRNWSGAEFDFVGLGPYANMTLDIEPQAFAQEFDPLTTNEWYRFVVSLNENNLKLKYWKLPEEEPSSWLMDIVDSNNSHMSGSIGFGNYWLADTLIDNVKVNAIPEPASLLLMGSGLLGTFLKKRKIN